MTTDHAKDLFAERDAEDAASGDYNPKLSLSQLMAPTPDGKLSEYVDASLVRCLAEVVVGARTIRIEYARVMTAAQIEAIVFEQGPTFKTSLVDSTPLTAPERDAALKLLNP